MAAFVHSHDLSCKRFFKKKKRRGRKKKKKKLELTENGFHRKGVYSHTYVQLFLKF